MKEITLLFEEGYVCTVPTYTYLSNKNQVACSNEGCSAKAVIAMTAYPTYSKLVGQCNGINLRFSPALLLCKKCKEALEKSGLNNVCLVDD